MLLLVGLGACATISDDLRRADELYREARYEDAEAWMVALGLERASMEPAQRVHFEYLRAMCAYRLDAPEDDALHYLLLADTLARAHPQVLSRRDQEMLARALGEHLRRYRKRRGRGADLE